MEKLWKIFHNCSIATRALSPFGRVIAAGVMVSGRSLGRVSVAAAIVAELVALAVRVAGGIRPGRAGVASL
jgi:hypothetical protein